MSALSIQPPYPIFTESDGLPLENGYIWIGAANLDPQGNPINVYWDAALTQPAGQPIRTINGYPSNRGTPARLYVNSDYSIRVQNSKGSLVYSAPEDLQRFNIDASEVQFIQAGTGAIVRTVQEKLEESISIEDFGASSLNSAAQNATALLAVEATGANDIFVPPGTYNVTGTTVLTKRYYGPGQIVFSGIGSTTFVGAGLNDATFSGSYNGNRPLQIVIKINSTGTPDTLAYSFNGGATFVTTQEVYDPVTDSYIVGPINIVSGAMQIFGTGAYVTFGATTGHTLNNSWSFTLTPNLQTVNTQGTTFSVQGAPFAAAFGVQNTQLGINSFGNLNSVGSGNTSIGYDTLYANTTGYANTAVGALSLRANTTGFFNQAIGNATLVHCTSGHENTAIGTYSLYDLTTSSANTAVGVDTQRYLSTGSENTALGVQALYQNVTGLQNVAVGLYALRGGSSSLSIGRSCNYNTAMGARAQFEGIGQYNSAFGHEAGYTITGNYNCSFGATAGTKTTAGDYNIFIGYQAGSNASQSLLASNSIAIGDGAYTTGDNAVAIGSSVSSPANIFTVCNSAHTFFRPGSDNVTALGGPSNRWSVVYAATGAINTSDERQKQQIKPIDAAALRAWAKVEYCQYKFNDAVEKKGAGARWHFGLIAQRVKEAFESEGLNAFEYGVLCHDTWEDGDRYGIRYEEALALECAYLRSQLSSNI